MWRPNRKQWWIIWLVFGLALIASVNCMHGEWRSRAPTTDEQVSEALLELQEKLATDPKKKADIHQELVGLREGRTMWVQTFDPSADASVVITFLVIGGALAVWRLQDRKPD